MEKKRLSYLVSDNTVPYENIAVEEYLMTHVEPGEYILYLWQNRQTVVIGYNQNAWKECQVERLEAEGGFLARRLSGGGAVFHDMGNLNFTFLTRRQDYDTGKQTEVILRAVQSFGIPAVKNGRNDLTVDERKFSGHAYYQTGDFCYHHGTVLIQTDKEKMSRYLNVSAHKLQSKGVESVKSRVCNLVDYVSGLTVAQMRKALLQAFAEVYGSGDPEQLRPIRPDWFNRKELSRRVEEFASWDWLYGRKIPFNVECSRRYSWGEVLIHLEVSEGIIRQAGIWTDALEIQWPGLAEQALIGVKYQRNELEAALGPLFPNRENMVRDLVSCIASEEEEKD